MTNEHRIALVTGANRGIGYAVARRFAARGLTVLVSARDPERAAAAVDRLRADPGVPAGRAGGARLWPLTLDVTDRAGVSAAARQVDDRFGRLDVLVNNAGISGGMAAQLPSATTVETMREVFATNLFGVLAVTNALLPLLRRSTAARIVNVSSAVGSFARQSDPGHYLSGQPPLAAYPAAKAALTMLTVQYARELRSAGILVNAAAPGACDTGFTRELALGRRITRTADRGAAVVERLALLGPDGPSGGFFDEDGPVDW
ncbi:SDR family NAD(P)-dependent oxidoreductase [Kitasatospora sp. NPDC057198]|uniref:SDR family NAD(P)-dependent oxidoreductase n=1 Tax=Kitasatospora sp. NPDC057198 TaxID=3346046 RepID=UPI003641C2E6